MSKVWLVDGAPNINLLDISIEQRVLASVADSEVFTAASEDELPEEIYNADVIVLWHRIKITEKTINRLMSCHGIVRVGVGFDNVDIKAAGAKGIPVFNIPDYGTREVADHTVAMILSLCRRLKIYDTKVRESAWDWRSGQPLTRLSELTLGIVGVGRIGSEVLRRASVFGFQIVFYDPYLPQGVENKFGAKRASSLMELLRLADVVTIHAPLNDQTKHMFSEKEFRAMKPAGILINTARGGIVDTAVLIQALQNHTLAGLGLDVWESEPVVPAELLNYPNVILTPHTAFYSEQSLYDLRKKSAELAKKLILDEQMPEPVNQEFLA